MRIFEYGNLSNTTEKIAFNFHVAPIILQHYAVLQIYKK